jgi:hypothetical protein
MKKLYTLMLLAISYSTTIAQHTLSGYVRDVTNGEELIGVTVYVNEISNGVVTNPYGFYSITLPEGTYNVQYSYIGYDHSLEVIDLSANVSLNIDLKESPRQIDEVVITGDPLDANVTDIKMSRDELDIQQVKKLPALFGEPDIIKTIQMLPGVLSAGEGTSAFFVRGGSADQNLILIDEAPVYDPSHLFGLFSVFNADVIKESELYKGGIPAQYGGRLSSILDVRTKDGNNKQLGGSAGLGLLASRIMLEGPIKKDKSSFIVSARRSYVDLFLMAAGEKSLVYFYDVNAKANWRINNKNRFFVALYTGRDDFSFDDEFGFDWGNRTATFRWNHLFNDRLFSNTSLIASTFDYGLELKDDAQGFLWTSSLQEYSFKEDLTYFINPSNELSFGYHMTVRKFSPGKIKPQAGSINKGVELQKDYALDHALYMGNEQRLSDKITLQYGVRLSIFQNVGKREIYTYQDRSDNIQINRLDTLHFDQWEKIKTYVNFEPRFSMRYILTPTSSVKASYNRMVQNTHLISSGTVPLPFNTWSPSGYYLEPQIADQVAVGYFRNIKDNAFEFSAEVYYKDMNNVTDFADNAQIFFNEDLSTEYRQGDADSYGLELMLKKKEGKLTGFASYTLSKTQRTVPDVNQGNTFLANYDRRNSFNAVATYEMDDQWTFGVNLTYSTGRPLTTPSANYDFGDGYVADLYTERNGYTLPAFHRMDLSATYTPRKNEGRKWESSWNFSLYNAYSRKNVFSVYTRPVEDSDGNVIDPTQKETRKVSLFPVLPSVTYNIKF